MILFFKAVLGNIASLIMFPSFITASLHKIRGVKIRNVFNVFISFNVTIDNIFPELITIGEDVKITRNVTILAHFHPTKNIAEFYGEMVTGTVSIGNGVFIGIGSIILPNVSIGEGSVIGAGSVVTKDVPPYTVVAGNPARVIKKLK